MLEVDVDGVVAAAAAIAGTSGVRAFSSARHSTRPSPRSASRKRSLHIAHVSRTRTLVPSIRERRYRCDNHVSCHRTASPSSAPACRIAAGCPTRPPWRLMAQSSRRAIADAGLTKDDIDGFGGHGTLLPPVEVSEYLGLRPAWVDATNVGGSSWEVMARHAAAAIAIGEIEVALLTYGSTARSDVKRRARASAAAMSTGGAMQFEAPYGATLIAKYAMAARRHMIEYGTTVEQLAEVAVAAHEWAAMNDNAFERERITVADVAAAPMLADPFTTKHVCLRTDGGGAVVLASERVARIARRSPSGFSARPTRRPTSA